jgi:hypothetical protein
MAHIAYREAASGREAARAAQAARRWVHRLEKAIRGAGTIYLSGRPAGPSDATWK